jgi:serine/threonine-protein kinase
MESRPPSNDSEVCPPSEILAALSHGELDETVVDAMARHLGRCEGCVSALSELHAHPPVGGLDARVRACLADREAAVAVFSPLPRRPAADGRRGGMGPENPEHPRSSTAAQTPTRVGRYVILGTVGEGGMGVVHQALDPEVGQVVALKMISDRGRPGPDRIARFRTEGQALARLCHPNVVRFLHFGEHGGRPYYTMEFVEGGSLQGRLGDGPLPPREAAELVRTLASAIHAAHQQRVIHRDLKPSNVLFAADGSPKVADFGLAKLLDADPGQGLTGSGTAVGTACYMAPEQADGRTDQIGRRTDVYGLGTILYEALSGKPPFAGADPHEILRLVREGRITPPSRLVPGIPSGLDAICLRCLETSPAGRYPSAHAVAEDLTRWLADQRPRAVPGLFGTLVHSVRRRAIAVAAVAAIALACAVFYVFDPDRPLRELQSAIDRGENVVLIPDRGAPRWHRLLAGGDGTKVTTPPDGSFTVHSWDLCLVELAPDSGRDRYRFRVRVRHVNSDDGGGVGVYAGRHAFPGQEHENNLFVGMVYNDVRSAADALKRAPFHLIPQPPSPPDNWVRLGAGVVGEQAPGVGWEVLPAGMTGARFQPRGITGDTWRELNLEVSPDGIRGTWDGNPVGAFAARSASKTLGDYLTLATTRHPDSPFLASVDSTFTPRGGVGLILYRGSASFRTAEIMPLPDVP